MFASFTLGAGRASFIPETASALATWKNGSRHEQIDRPYDISTPFVALERSVVGCEEHIRRKKLGVCRNLALGLGVTMLVMSHNAHVDGEQCAGDIQTMHRNLIFIRMIFRF